MYSQIIGKYISCQVSAFKTPFSFNDRQKPVYFSIQRYR